MNLDDRKQIENLLRGIYPPHLLLLSLSPFIIGCFIDAELVSFREILISLVWIPFFSIPAFLFNKRVPLQIGSLIYFIFAFVEICHWVILKGPITLTSILVLANTNFQEALSFFDLKASFGLMILLPLIFLYIFSTRQSIPQNNHQYSTRILLIVLFISSVFIAENAFKGRLVRKGIPHMAKVMISASNKLSLYREAAKENFPKKVVASSILPDKNQTFVLILGESCNRNHMSLYGYKRATNPRLGTRKDLIVFDDVVSPYSNTLNSVLTILSEANLENNLEFTNAIDVIDVFHSAGFKTYWISNQSPIGIWDNLVTVFANKSEDKKFVNLSSNSSFEAMYAVSYDEKVLLPFSKVLEEQENKKLIVVHLMGSHATYAKRYPNGFSLFQGKDDKSKTIAEYDNSILYNDFIVDSLFSLLTKKSWQDHTSLYSAIYLADHGENVYDELDHLGHDYSKYLPKANVEIPFIVWLSESFKMQDEKKVKAIMANKHLPFVADDLFHAMLDLNAINTSFLDKKRSNLNENYNQHRKRVLVDEMDVDEK